MFRLGLTCYWPLGTVILALCESAAGSQLSPEKSGVWGPGLRAELVLPARYFYIQAVDTEGKR